MIAAPFEGGDAIAINARGIKDKRIAVDLLSILIEECQRDVIVAAIGSNQPSPISAESDYWLVQSDRCCGASSINSETLIPVTNTGAGTT